MVIGVGGVYDHGGFERIYEKLVENTDLREGFY